MAQSEALDQLNLNFFIRRKFTHYVIMMMIAFCYIARRKISCRLFSLTLGFPSPNTRSNIPRELSRHDETNWRQD
jgi:hypothetical protein